MNYSQVPLMTAMKQQMSFLGSRQAVLAQNIANADTPGYKAQDVNKPEFSGMMAVQLWRTNPAHMAGAKNTPAFKTFERKPTWETTPTENTVAIEEEIQKMSLNASSYQQVSQLYRKTTDMFRTAIGRTS